MKLFDLTGTLEPGMWRYDHIPSVEISLVSSIEDERSLFSHRYNRKRGIK